MKFCSSESLDNFRCTGDFYILRARRNEFGVLGLVHIAAQYGFVNKL